VLIYQEWSLTLGVFKVENCQSFGIFREVGPFLKSAHILLILYEVHTQSCSIIPALGTATYRPGISSWLLAEVAVDLAVPRECSG